MEFFHKAKAVRLRSHLGKYLVAYEDEETVRQSRNGSSQRARWTVQFVQGDTHLIRLKSVYNKYLTATNEPFLLGMTGKKVMQAIPSSKHDHSSIDWEPITDRNQVKLRTRSSGKFLRANGGTPPWRNSVTHDVPHRTATQDWILWEVDIVDILESSDFPSSDFSSSIASSFSSFSTFSSNSDLPALLVSDSFDEHAFRTQASNFLDFVLANLESGKKVSQSLPKRLDSSVEWEPIRDGVQVRLRTRYGQYLRANAGLPPWRNSVTHDVPHRTATQDWVLWDVDIVEFRKKDPDPDPPPPPAPVLSPSPTFSPPPVEIPQPIDRIDSDRSDPGSPSAISLRGPRMGRVESDDSFCSRSRVSFEGRVINYEVIDDDGNVDEAIGERTFTFKGSGVEELKQMLQEEAGVNEEVCICSRNPLNGQLYPLRLHLPPNNAAMNLVVVPLSSKG
ncbi:hypothetical protein CCACVL1_13873 [Corchorus capsularis]|uniref:DUF569 domain-containing protein n=1 Tax=Corchorus capsularis TaxID=210143 RepID=A0A1R3I9A2_COCAP|nr:hypothetical protein CCACVL1_13873 [Corchorus capsularis]